MAKNYFTLAELKAKYPDAEVIVRDSGDYAWRFSTPEEAEQFLNPTPPAVTSYIQKIFGTSQKPAVAPTKPRSTPLLQKIRKLLIAAAPAAPTTLYCSKETILDVEGELISLERVILRPLRIDGAELVELAGVPDGEFLFFPES